MSRSLGAAQIEPYDEGGHGDAQDNRHKVAGDGVGEALDRRLGALRLLDHADDLLQDSITAHPGGAEAERAGLIQRAASHQVSRCLHDRHWFAREHAFIDGGTTGKYLTIRGNFFAGADDNDVAGLDLLDWNILFDAIPIDTSGLRLEPHQRGWRRWSCCGRGPLASDREE